MFIMLKILLISHHMLCCYCHFKKVCIMCIPIPIATFEISNAIWGPREVIVVSWKVFFTFIVIAKKNIKLLSGNFILFYYIIGHWSLWPIDMYINIYLNLNDPGHQSGQKITSSLINALVYVAIDWGIHKGKMKVARNEKRKKLSGFSLSINIAIFEAFL